MVILIMEFSNEGFQNQQASWLTILSVYKILAIGRLWRPFARPSGSTVIKVVKTLEIVDFCHY